MSKWLTLVCIYFLCAKWVVTHRILYMCLLSCVMLLCRCVLSPIYGTHMATRVFVFGCNGTVCCWVVCESICIWCAENAHVTPMQRMRELSFRSPVTYVWPRNTVGNSVASRSRPSAVRHISAPSNSMPHGRNQDALACTMPDCNCIRVNSNQCIYTICVLRHTTIMHDLFVRILRWNCIAGALTRVALSNPDLFNTFSIFEGKDMTI